MFAIVRNWRVLVVSIGTVAVMSAAAASPVSAKTKSPAITHLPSYAVFDNNGASAGSTSSACTSAGCANGIRFEWDAGVCVNGDHFSPIVVVFTIHHKVAANTWPMVAPCSSGIQMTWDKNNHLAAATWTGNANAAYGMAVCFQHANQCGHSICVTDGCLPANTDGVDIFFEGTGSLVRADWTRNGRPAGSVTPSGVANDVYWYGSAPPKSPFAQVASRTHRLIASQAIAPPTVSLLGRNAGFYPQISSAIAPSTGHDINFKWFLSPAGPNKQCIVAGGTAWTNPPMEFAYTTAGALNSRMFVLTCPLDAAGTPVFYNGVDFSWAPSADGTRNNVVSAIPTFNSLPMTGLPANLIPQPPAGTDGILFEFHHDDYDQSSWPPDPTVLQAPGHTRMVTWRG